MTHANLTLTLNVANLDVVRRVANALREAATTFAELKRTDPRPTPQFVEESARRALERLVEAVEQLEAAQPAVVDPRATLVCGTCERDVPR